MEKVKWLVSILVCRICSCEHVAVYPENIYEEDNQECPNCGHMTCGVKDVDLNQLTKGN